MAEDVLGKNLEYEEKNLDKTQHIYSEKECVNCGVGVFLRNKHKLADKKGKKYYIAECSKCNKVFVTRSENEPLELRD